jgi:hypothetical protein
MEGTALMHVTMRDTDLLPMGELRVTDVHQVVRRNDVSTWSMEINARPGESWEDYTDGMGVIIHDDHGDPLTGPHTEEEFDRDGARRTLKLQGVCDNVLLADHIIIPDPDHPTDGAEVDVWRMTGPAETVMRALVNAQIGPDAPDLYRIPDLTLEPDQGRGAEVTVSGRYDNLLETMQELATTGGVDFRITQVGRRRVLQFREGEDLARAVRLEEERGGITKLNLKRKAPTVTEAIAGGSGSGKTRKMWRDTQPTTWGRRITEFVDRPSTSDTNELQQAVEKALRDGQEQVSCTFETADTAHIKYGRDYQLGDRITLHADRVTVQDTVQVADVRWRAGARTVSLQVGPVADESKLAEDSPIPAKMRQRLRELSQQVRRRQTD